MPQGVEVQVLSRAPKNLLNQKIEVVFWRAELAWISHRFEFAVFTERTTALKTTNESISKLLKKRFKLE